MKGYIFDIKKFAIHDGPGIRTTVFLSGCPLNCSWCHNPESRLPLVSENGNKLVFSEEVMAEIEKDSVFYDESGGGVTFSGGEPLYQFEFLFDLLELCQKAGFHVALDTTGYSSLERIKKVAPLTDLFLYDLKIMDEKKHIEFTGVDNKKIQSNFKYLAGMGKDIIVRIPLIPGYNDNISSLVETAVFLRDTGGISRIDLLPYHRLGLSKYAKLGLPFKTKHIVPPGKEKINEAREIFESYGFNISIGG